MPKRGSNNANEYGKFELVLTQGQNQGKVFVVEDGDNLVGRWDPDSASFPEIDLTNDDPEAKVSRKHAILLFEDGKLTYEVLGSLNGSYLKSQKGAQLKLSEGAPQELRDGDEIVIGKTVLKVRRVE